MQYKVRLPIKSHASSFYDIMKIVEQNSHYQENKFQYVVFDEPSVDLEQVIDLARSLSAFKFYIDDKEISKSNIRHIERIIFCEHKTTCEGFCTRTALRAVHGFRWFNVEKIIRLLSVESLYSEELEDMEDLTILGRKQGWHTHQEEESKDIYSFDQAKLITEVRNGLKFELEYCQIINWERIENGLHKIPTVQTFDKPKEENLVPKPVLVELKEEQLEVLAQRIAQEITEALRNLFRDAGLLKTENTYSK